MTKEKQIEEMEKDLIITNSYGTLNAVANYLYNKGYRKQEWISVEERLPETEGDYLVWNTEQRKVEKRFFYRLPLHYPVESHPEIREYFGDFMDYKKITHWMPFPKPPKMKGE